MLILTEQVSHGQCAVCASVAEHVDAAWEGTENGVSTETAKRTPLYEEHQKLGARMIPFGGWDMPVQYTGIIEEHRAVRNAAGIFDLGHMGQASVSGPDAQRFVQYVATNDLNRIPDGLAQYSILCRPSAGRWMTSSSTVCRIASSSASMPRIPRRMSTGCRSSARPAGMDCTVENLSDTVGMLAVQGPRALGIVQQLTETDLERVAPLRRGRDDA